MTRPAPAALFCELNAHSCYSLLEGAATPAALIARAAALEMPALALTDRDGIYGVVEFVTAARAAGVRPILGCDLTLADGRPLTLLAADTTGWANLCQLITAARCAVSKGEARLPRGVLAHHTAGLIALCGAESSLGQAVRAGDAARAVQLATRLRDLFGRANLALQLSVGRYADDAWRNHAFAALADQVGVAVVAGNAPVCATADEAPLQDVLTCLRRRIPLDRSTAVRRPNRDGYLQGGEAVAAWAAAFPRALAQTARLAERCQFALPFGRQPLPAQAADEMEALAHLRALCAASPRVPSLAPYPEWQAQLAHELDVIAQARLADYFLLVHDLCRFAREQGIPHQGRGSAGNALIAYLLQITPVNPLAHALVFERFLSAERPQAPDIDLDFCAARREEAIQYLYRRYGPDHTAMACTFSTFRTRAALRDAAWVLGLTADDAARVRDALEIGETAVQQLPAPLQRLADVARRLDGLPRHLGLHNGGMVLCGPPLATHTAVEPAAMAERSVVQWDKESLEAAGWIKLDVLGLRMLSAVAEAVVLIGQRTTPPDLDALTPDDPAVYAMLEAADTLGVFQVESRAQAQLLPRLKPRSFTDLLAAVSLIRPGPIQAQAVQPYLRRRAGQESVVYLHPRLEPALAETYGVLLFQEQAIKVARDLGGLSAGEGELLRRALGGKRGAAGVAALRERFLAGARAQGASEVVATAVFGQLEAFGGYAFAKAHAAAFAMLVYRSAWLRHYHPAAYFCALLNNQPMGFWTPAVLARDAQRRGIVVLGVSINQSAARCTPEGARGVRLGFNMVTGCGAETAVALAAARGERPFVDLADLHQRARLPRALLEQLVLAGALDDWGPRRRLLWAVGRLRDSPVALPAALPLVIEAPVAALPDLSSAERQAQELAATGVSTGPHVLALRRAELTARGWLDGAALARAPAGTRITTAGMLVVRQQPPTAKGFVFLTLEDETGLINVIVAPWLAVRYRALLAAARLLWAMGIVERGGDRGGDRAVTLRLVQLGRL